ncbi:non-ribosomal peptide synthetase [Xenorhabdus cabanillasii]|uniref:non-ribosomal peptide synthetase n=2 Tax=Xenorhabdus cabanillasii TaxID=351673 RepID=UPI000C06657A|nr:non-ribosomal peptide synthetase [Xenorhabdus cabanillasii]PHM75435.1 pvdj [Xenorhabdus cabanillasii JM26]
MVYHTHDDGQIYQQILHENLVIKSQSCEDVNTLLDTVRAEIATPFDLTTEPSLRLCHYPVSDSHYLLLLWHHIAIDGWSIDIFMAELAEIYQSLRENRDSQLAALDITYGDYAVWQRDYLQGDIRERQLTYWRQTLARHESLALPTDYPRPAQVNYQGRNFSFELNTRLSEQLRRLAKTQETTLYTVLLSAFYVTLAKLSGQNDIVLGTPTDNRHHAQTQPLIGMFVNSLVLRAQLQQTVSVEALIEQTHKQVAEAKAHQDMPFEQLVEALGIERDTARHPIFQIMFSLQGAGENPSDNRLPFRPVTLDDSSLYSPAKFDLSLFMSDGQTSITAYLNYAVSLFNEATIVRLAESYQRVLEAFVADQKQPLSALDILSAQERHTLLHTWNQTDAPYPQDKTLQQLFEAQVERTPDNVALVFEGATLTYRQLNERANQLACVIRERYQQQNNKTMPADTPIALYLDRSPEMVITILAVLKAGGAYVPISPAYPAERVQFILADTATPCVLTQQRHLTTLAEYSQILTAQPVLIAADDRTITAGQPVENPVRLNRSTDLAYIIYTSGTTGQPKGVMIEHKNVAHMVATQAEFFDATKRTKALMFAAYVFDGSVFELFPGLFNGLTIYLCSETERNAPAIARLIQRENIEIAVLPPALLKLLIGTKLPSLQLLVTAGESPSLDFLAYFSQYSRVLNAYGPTEVTVVVTGNVYQHGDLATNIGKAIHNVRLYVLDNYGNLSPVGAPGELYIGGAGLAQGYLNRTELTAERFVVNPFATDKDKEYGYTRLYKTGDLVRWRPDGKLEYLGRNDFQVKIRGYRIEPGEIESALASHPQVKQAVVIDREHNGNKVLAAYLVTEGALSDDSLIGYLSSRLPEYMVPPSFTFIDSIPLTLNGKVDRRALPEPVWGNRDSYVAPRNALETRLCTLWQEVLGLERVGIEDNFFRIGGDSIVSIQLVSKLRQAGFSLQVKSIFEAPTVARLALLLTQSSFTENVVAEQGLLSGEFDLLPVQQAFFDWDLSNPHHWNQAFMIRVPGNIKSAQIGQALIMLAERHDMLRARFIDTGNGYRQCYSRFQDCSGEMPPSHPLLQHCDIRGLNKEEQHQQLTQWQNGFDYNNGPLWQAGHLTGYADGSARLFFAFHHLIIDTVSWRIIAEDMRLLLQGMTLPPKTSSYRQWVIAVHRYAQQHQDEVPYWQQVIAGNDIKPAQDDLTRHLLSISAEMTDILLHEANTGYHTEINDLLLSALTLALQETFSQAVNHILLEGHGRESIDNTLDISETVGWFTTMYPVRLAMQTDIAETIIYTKEMLRTVPNKGIGYSTLHQAGHLTGYLPAISFNYLGQLEVTSHQDWCITNDDCGTVTASENGSHLLLGINGAVQMGKLQFSVDSRLPQAQTAIFITAFEQALNSVIATGQKQAQSGGVKTPSDYGIEGLSVKLLCNLQQRYQIEALYPATSLQQGFIYHHLAHPQDDAYRVQMLLDYHTNVDFAIYQQAWSLASLRFPILRTAFDWEEKILQIITMDTSIGPANFKIKDISQLSEENRNKAIDEIQQHDRTRPFNLSQPGLIRFTLIKQDEQLITVLITQHHCIVDGWSNPILLQTVHEYYNQLINGQTPQIVVEQAYLATQQYHLDHKAESDTYWSERKTQFQGANNFSALLSHHVDLTQIKTVEKPAEQLLTVQGNAYEQLKNMSRTQGVTLNVILQFAWHKLLHSYTGDEQTIVGTTVSGRDVPVDKIESSVGLYINTLPLMVQWDQTNSVAAVLQDIQKDIAALNSHSAVSLASLQSDGERLFHSLLIFENYPVPVASENKEGIEHTLTFRQSVEKVEYPISLMAYEQGNSLIMKLSYGENWLTEKQARRLLCQLERILHAVACNPNQSHTSITFLSEEERHTLLHTWNQTDALFPQDKTLQQLFEAQVERTPDNIALVFEGDTLTYRQLNERANQLAHHLIALGVSPDDRVAIYAERSLYLVVGLLAILKAGGAYVPLDPAQPSERLVYMIKDSAPVALLTQTALFDALTGTMSAVSLLADSLSANSLPIITLDNQVSLITALPDHNPNISELTADHLAYVIYTSGSTGQPKGVMSNHQTLCNRLLWFVRDIAISPLVAALKTSISFVDSITETLGTLLAGGKLVVFNNHDVKDPIRFSQGLRRFGVNYLVVVPSLLKLLLQNRDDSDCLKPIRLLICSGERLAPELARQVVTHYPQLRLLNFYGSSEINGDATWYEYRAAEGIPEVSVIGKPIANIQSYILDGSGQPVPIGVTGEIYIAGRGVARGYLNRPELTAERFLIDPFSPQPNARMFKTGDLGRWLPDGNIEYLGRNDFQVKIRGYRIELGEVENVLTSHPQVEQAVVIDHNHKGNKVLVAYLVADGALSDDTLIRYLSSRLPEYMLPASFTRVESVPLTLNGKLNRHALPEPIWGDRNNYAAPRNALETQLCTIWQEVLGLDQVGIDDNFFRIGGNSLMAIKLTTAIRHETGVDIPLNVLFNCKCISLLSQWLKTDNAKFSLLNSLTPKSIATNKLFMVHPANAGSEVYESLANTLSDVYKCIGIDNYNLCTDNQINSLHQLAQIYMELILTETSIDQPINILGWSLGGQLAMEIAFKLEQLGAKKIQLFLLDAIINNDELGELRNKLDMSNKYREITEKLQEMGASDTYINKVLEAVPFEFGIANCNLSGKLSHTNITLFKAGQMSLGFTY